MNDIEIPYHISENRIEFIQYIAQDEESWILIYNLSQDKYNLYCISDSQLNLINKKENTSHHFPLTADEIVEYFIFLPIETAKNLFPYHNFTEENYGF